MKRYIIGISAFITTFYSLAKTNEEKEERLLITYSQTELPATWWPS